MTTLGLGQCSEHSHSVFGHCCLGNKMGIWPAKNLCHSSAMVLLWKKVEKENGKETGKTRFVWNTAVKLEVTEVMDNF